MSTHAHNKTNNTLVDTRNAEEKQTLVSSLLQRSTGSLFKDAIRAAFAVYVGKDCLRLLFDWSAGNLFSIYHMEDPTQLVTSFLIDLLGTNALYKQDKGRMSSSIRHSPLVPERITATKFPTGVSFMEEARPRVFVRIPFEGTEFLFMQKSGITSIDTFLTGIIPVWNVCDLGVILYKNKDRDTFLRFIQKLDAYSDKEWRDKDGIFIPKLPSYISETGNGTDKNEKGPLPQVSLSSYRWSFFMFGRPSRVYLDDLPIHSAARERIDKHIQWCKREWDMSPNANHRAILLSGSPGTGKTSIAQAIATELGAYRYEFPYQDTSRGNFEILIGELPKNVVMIADEIDTHFAFQNRVRDAQWGVNPNQILSYRAPDAGIDQKCIFDYLSGPKSPSNVLTVMITNYPKKIDPAIKREGRTKEEIFVGDVDHAGLVRWLEHVYKRPYEGPVFIDMPLKYIFSCKEDAYTYEELIEALHKYDPSKEQNILNQEDALGG